MIPSNDEHVQKIIDWRESFATLPDHHFFELIRMYLGEIHTPYNKQKLIEELGSFLRKKENRKTLAVLLSDSDLQIISAVKCIPLATQEKLASFFSTTFTFAALYERLLNLEERLILYRHADKKTHQTVIDVNPMLDDVLESLISRSVLLTENSSKKIQQKKNTVMPLSPELIAAFVSYLFEDSGVCKSDGSFKKRALSNLEQVFPGRIGQLRLLMTAFINLSLVKENCGGYEIDRARFALFASLEDEIQYAYLCIASQGRFSRDGIMRQAQLLLDCAKSIPQNGFSRTMLLRSAFLISEKEFDVPGVAFDSEHSRFAQILSHAREAEPQKKTNALQTPAGPVIDRLVDSAAEFGILVQTGFIVSGDNESDTPNNEREAVYACGSLVSGESRKRGQKISVLSIDAGFTLTLLPGLPLEELLPLMDCMSVRQFDTAAVFEVTKKSVMRAFDLGMNTEGICALLSSYCPYGVPQNLRVSIEDWSKSYSSSALYKGYVLQVSKENCVFAEKNPAIAPYIKKILAPGIYLLSVHSDEEAQTFVSKSGLDFIGSIRTADDVPRAAGFPSIRKGRNQFAEEDKKAADSPFPRGTDKDRAELFDTLRQSLSSMNLSPEQTDGLLSRIQRKIIISSSQLRGDSVRMERIEAGGMDFLGKVHVIEHAITTNSMIELEYESEQKDAADSQYVTLVGAPVSIEKQTDDAVVCMRVEPEHEEKLFSIGKARMVKRIRGSVFKEREE
jgi:hypothetical protein